MYLSQNLSHHLEECYVTKTKLPCDFKFSFQVGGDWFCPGCGVQMSEEEGVVRCAKCGLSINEFIYELVERSPHKK